ncbi:heavy-metal-associated domain-containing protein [Nonomuraea gerenzanensis]|uniref:Copper chaperone n=1 Tax=Nonomuraea gerenzanensis TaxID=93944 RepID=A0A1M4DYW8_9ACTN|nr:copper ion binding protein [Nonomuraea gerenzanensis]UBU14062.1 copper ion binding protein [Nonomuraea gerenzanensis]SBO91752.1 Copper chaperone [Nonomuraea gerenzanensis]
MTVATYQVDGMTCGHCVSAVTEEVGKVTGVSGVEVDLASGAVTVTSAAPIDAALIGAAVSEAGYELGGKVDLLPQAGGSCCGSGGCH